jgi:hypothetical protein
MLEGDYLDIHVHIHNGEVKEGRAPKKRRSSSSPASKKAASSSPRKLSAWQRYMKNKKTQIKYKSGDKKGRLNLKAMSSKFKKTLKGKRSR